MSKLKNMPLVIARRHKPTKQSMLADTSSDRLPRIFTKNARNDVLEKVGDFFSFDMRPLYRKIAHSLTRFIYRPHYSGLENIPKEGAAVIISNHVSYMDGPIIDAGIYAHCGRTVRYVIDEDIYNSPGVHHIMSLARAIPISSNRKSVEAAFDAISEGLRAGDLICIFPEGYLTFTGGLGRFRHGIEWIIKRDPVPIIPVSLSGLWGSIFSRKFRGKWQRFLPRDPRKKVTVQCGKAIPPEHCNVNYLQEAVLKLKYSNL